MWQTEWSKVPFIVVFYFQDLVFENKLIVHLMQKKIFQLFYTRSAHLIQNGFSEDGDLWKQTPWITLQSP